MTEMKEAQRLNPGHNLSVTADHHERPGDDGWLVKEPTESGWARCTCGFKVETQDGGPVSMNRVKAQVQQHIAENEFVP